MLDLDKIEMDFINLDDKKYYFKQLSVEEAFKSDNFIRNIKLEAVNAKQIKKESNKLRKYIMMMIDIPEEVVNDLSFDYIVAIKNYIERSAFYAKGYSDEDLDKIERAKLLMQAEAVLMSLDEKPLENE